MASLADKKYIGGGANSTSDFFSNEEKWIKVTYDFANDTGAQADLEVIENESASANFVVTDFFAYVETAVTSAGNLVADLGISAGGTEWWSDKAKADLSIGTVHGQDTALPVKLAAAGKIVLGIEAADATAGKINFYFKIKQIV